MLRSLVGSEMCIRDRGMTVVMLSRNVSRLEALAEGIPGAVWLGCDVTKRSEVERCVAWVMDKYKRVDYLVNSAGVMYSSFLKNLHGHEWEEMIDVNCKGVVNWTGAVLPHMLKARTGHVINISSDVAKTLPAPALTVYNASKAFVAVFTKGLRTECVGTGIRVTDIRPGATAPNPSANNTNEEAVPKIESKVASGKPVARDRSTVLDPEDVADAVVYAAMAPAHVGIHELVIEPRDQTTMH
eukprot:TRINITY_DN9241_c0_g1_i2.p1 TRINITY_DN9241_c0_g1~~TRINITY_DN9241_c0_g1_i2.p1  ORF type:complete len:273 (-),score=83.12 TRINITY_DN9241_c0_g1_i2:312-1037(-)